MICDKNNHSLWRRQWWLVTTALISCFYILLRHFSPDPWPKFFFVDILLFFDRTCKRRPVRILTFQSSTEVICSEAAINRCCVKLWCALPGFTNMRVRAWFQQNFTAFSKMFCQCSPGHGRAHAMANRQDCKTYLTWSNQMTIHRCNSPISEV